MNFFKPIASMMPNTGLARLFLSAANPQSKERGQPCPRVRSHRRLTGGQDCPCFATSLRYAMIRTDGNRHRCPQADWLGASKDSFHAPRPLTLSLSPDGGEGFPGYGLFVFLLACGIIAVAASLHAAEGGATPRPVPGWRMELLLSAPKLR